ncbi:MAG: DUF1566 domain-containing protein [Pseudomonadota bacterium]
MKSNGFSSSFFKCVPFLLTGLCALASLGASAQSRYTPSADGTQVTDTTTGLVWQRCSQGQSWSAAASTCTGTVGTYTYEAALALAQTQTGWRLPSIKELASIVDPGKVNPSIDTTAFPATSSSYFWSATPVVGKPDDAWFVYFLNGDAYDGSRNDDYLVRLVR